MLFMGDKDRKRRSSSMPAVARHAVDDDGRQTLHGWVDAGARPPKCRRVNMAVEVSHATAAKRQRRTLAKLAELLEELMRQFEEQQKQWEPSAEADSRNDPLRDQQQEPGQTLQGWQQEARPQQQQQQQQQHQPQPASHHWPAAASSSS